MPSSAEVAESTFRALSGVVPRAWRANSASAERLALATAVQFAAGHDVRIVSDNVGAVQAAADLKQAAAPTSIFGALWRELHATRTEMADKGRVFRVDKIKSHLADEAAGPEVSITDIWGSRCAGRLAAQHVQRFVHPEGVTEHVEKLAAFARATIAFAGRMLAA